MRHRILRRRMAGGNPVGLPARLLFLACAWTAVISPPGECAPAGDTAALPDLVPLPSSLLFVAEAGGPNPPAQSLVLGVTNGQTAFWDAYHIRRWLSFAPASATAPSTLSVALDISDLQPGVHWDTLRFESNEAANSPLFVPVQLVLPMFEVSDSDSISVVPHTRLIPDRGADTTFHMALTMANARPLGAMAIPLSFAGHPALRIDTSVVDPSGNTGVTYGPAGRATDWTFRTALLDHAAQTILLGFITFGSFRPRADTLVYLHFALDSSGVDGIAYIDSTTVHTSHLTFTDTMAGEYTPTWSGGLIRIGDPPPASRICLDTSSLVFHALVGGEAPPPQMVTLTNCGDGVLHWTATHDADWMDAWPAYGCSNAALISVGISTTDLPADTLRATVTIADAEAANSPQTIYVMYVLSEYVPEDTNFLVIVPETTYVASANLDTTFRVAIVIDNQTRVIGITIPLTFAGHPALLIDTTAGGPGHWGVTFGPAGANPVWSWAESIVDNVARTIVLEFYGYPALPPMRDTLAYIHFRLDSSGVSDIVPIDTAFVAQTYHLRVQDFASETPGLEWSGGFIHIDSNPIPTRICLSPASLAFSAVRYGPLPAAKSIALVNCGGGELDWSVTDNAAWLTVLPPNGLTNTATLAVNVTSTDLPVGTHGATITVTSPNSVNSPQTVAVGYTVSAGSDRMYLKPASITLPGGVDTSFRSTVMLDLKTLDALAITVPLTFADSAGALRVDTTVTDGFGNRGVTQGPLGRDTAWSVRTVLVDNEAQNILIGYINFGAGLPAPRHDSLMTIHFALSAVEEGTSIRIDTTTIPPSNSLSIIGPWAEAFQPGWTGGTVETETGTGVRDDGAILPELALLPPYPNPFNLRMTVRFTVGSDRAGHPVTLSIHNVLGEHVRTLVDQPLPSGEHHVTWDGRDANGREVGSGVYFVLLVSGSQQRTAKAMLIK